MSNTIHDWVEDFPHENGNYICLCVRCNFNFFGHKRRVVCRACDAKEVERAANLTDEERLAESIELEQKIALHFKSRN